MKEILGDPDDTHSVAYALDIACIGGPYKAYQGSLYMEHQTYRCADFQDYGLALAVEVLCNNAKLIRAALAQLSEPTVAEPVAETVLTKDQRFLLEWLAKEDFSSLGECHGPDLEALVERGLALVMGRRVSVTDLGFAALKATPSHVVTPGVLDQMAAHPGWSLETGHRNGDEEDDYGWIVYEVRGGRNDREWREVGFGDTPRAALIAALIAALSPATSQHRAAE